MGLKPSANADRTVLNKKRRGEGWTDRLAFSWDGKGKEIKMVVMNLGFDSSLLVRGVASVPEPREGGWGPPRGAVRPYSGLVAPQGEGESSG